MDGDNTQVQAGETVGLPQENFAPPRNGANRWIIVGIILALLALGAGVFFLLRSNQEAEVVPTPTPFVSDFTPEPTETPKPVDKSSVDIEILNGTGIAKEASYLMDILRNMGYRSITTGNVDRQDPTITEVTFAKTLPQEVVNEITGKLKEIYKQVKTSTGTLAKSDVKIVVGLKKGATAKPSATPTPKPTTTASPTATSTASPTPTSTPS